MTVPQSSLVPPREAPPFMPFTLLTVDSGLWHVLLLTPLQLSHQPNPGVPSRKCPAGWRRWEWQAESDEAGSFYQLHGRVPDHPAQRLPNPRLQGKFGHCGGDPTSLQPPTILAIFLWFSTSPTQTLPFNAFYISAPRLLPNL